MPLPPPPPPAKATAATRQRWHDRIGRTSGERQGRRHLHVGLAATQRTDMSVIRKRSRIPTTPTPLKLPTPMPTPTPMSF